MTSEDKYLKTLTLPQQIKMWLGASQIEVFFKGKSLVEIRILKQYEEVIKNEQ